jgi:hypothetical protein
MQLLHGSPVAFPQFASLSIVTSEGMVEPVITVAPTATCSSNAAVEVIRELHCYVKSILKSNESTGFAAELLREDEQTLLAIQVHRPLAASGLAMHYRFISENAATEKLQSFVLPSNKVDPSSNILGVIICVAVTGPNTVFCASSVPYSLARRIDDCIEYLQRLTDVASARELLTVYLLTDDESRITNSMMEAPDFLLLPGESDDRAKGILSPMGMISPIAEFGRKTARRASTGIVRGVMNAGGAINSTMDAPPPVELGFPLVLHPSSADAARALTDRLTVLSVADSSTFLRKYEHSGQERKANLDLTGGTKSRFRRRRTDARDADFDHFDYKGLTKETVKRESKAVPVIQPAPEPAQGKLLFKSSSKDTKRGPGTRRLSTQMGQDDSNISQKAQNRLSDSIDPKYLKGRSRTQFDDETNDSRSQSGNHDGSSVVSHVRLQVNIALNEDLSCSYKLSQLSSCSVDGIVQVCYRFLFQKVVATFSQHNFLFAF